MPQTLPAFVQDLPPHERDFVLAPWLALDPDAVLPGRGRVADGGRRLHRQAEAIVLHRIRRGQQRTPAQRRQDGDARGVVAAVLEAGEALKGNVHGTGEGCCGTGACVSDDSTHGAHANGPRRV